MFIFQLRFQKCIDAHPEIVQKVTATEQEKAKEKIDKEKEKVSWSKCTVQLKIFLENYEISNDFQQGTLIEPVIET